MKTRMVEILGPAARETSARTFHGLCALILRSDAETLGIPGDFVIYDEEDSREVFGRLWRARGLPVNPEKADNLDFCLWQAASTARLSRYDDPAPRKGHRFGSWQPVRCACGKTVGRRSCSGTTIWKRS
jgi:superfamily I DNA/RNA helicase